jgi:hypothetical protein
MKGTRMPATPKFSRETIHEYLVASDRDGEIVEVYDTRERPTDPSDPDSKPVKRSAKEARDDAKAAIARRRAEANEQRRETGPPPPDGPRLGPDTVQLLDVTAYRAEERAVEKTVVTYAGQRVAFGDVEDPDYAGPEPENLDQRLYVDQPPADKTEAVQSAQGALEDFDRASEDPNDPLRAAARRVLEDRLRQAQAELAWHISFDALLELRETWQGAGR